MSKLIVAKQTADSKLQSLKTPQKISLTLVKRCTILRRSTKVPVYPGGDNAFFNFLIQNLKYPPLAKEKKVEGNVLLSFVIAEDGSATDIKVEKSLGSGTDEEAIRVVRLAKKWKPGVKNGEPVNSLIRIPIKFSLKS